MTIADQDSPQPTLSGSVAITGRPNAGKSTLLNAILGSELSLVTHKAQTTRDLVRGILTEPERGQILFEDTPGIHQAREGGLNAAMLGQVRMALEAPDAIWYLVHPKSAPEHEAIVLKHLNEWAPRKAGIRPPLAMILTHADHADWCAQARDRWLESWITELEKAGWKPERFAVGKLAPEFLHLGARVEKTEGITRLMEWTWRQMPAGPWAFPDPEQLSDRHLRFFVGEMIRGALFEQLEEELPYSCAVEVHEFKEKDPTQGAIQIGARIWVERDSQKPMVIGRGGQKIKKLGIQSRRELEAFLQQRVNLKLMVDVAPQWTRDPSRLKELGYVLPESKRG